MPSKLTTQEFIRRANILHDSYYNYSKVDYQHGRIKITIICPVHGDFSQDPNTHLEGKGCQKCKAVKTAKALSYTTDDFVKKAITVHGDKYDYSNVSYSGSTNKVTIRCFKHGLYDQPAYRHLRGHGCSECAIDGFKLSSEDFLNRSNTIHGDRYNYDLTTYINGYTKVKIECTEHGVFEQTPSSHLNGTGCPNCHSSKGEELIARILKKNNIPFTREYKIPTSGYKFRYDFHLPDHNLLIEFHGVQHFEPVSYFGGEETLSKVMLRDRLKRELAEFSKFKYLEIHHSLLHELTNEEFERRLIYCTGK